MSKLTRKAAKKMARVLGMELEAAELAIKRAYFVTEREDLERRARELNQALKEQTMRYTLTVFPARLGKPLNTNSRILAYLVWVWRSFFHLESRMIDNKTGKHKIR